MTLNSIATAIWDCRRGYLGHASTNARCFSWQSR